MIFRSNFKLLIMVCCLLIILPVYSQETETPSITYNGKTYNLYPAVYEELPDFPSPFKTETGDEIILAFTEENKKTLINVTVEIGRPMNYIKNQWDKGDQLKSDEADFPALAKTGLHSDLELDLTRSITGKSIAEITELGRPERSSGAGFMAADENIISVLKGDNNLVKKMGLTHTEVAKPLFNIFNMILEHRHAGESSNRHIENISCIQYNSRKISVGWGGAKGWQSSIFNDEVLGYYQININIKLSEEEASFLDNKYSNLSTGQKNELIKKLTNIHSGEMVPYYIQRYGFYEGHTSYRTDPIAVSFIFGLQSLKEIEEAFPGKLYSVLTEHFAQK